MKEEELLKHYLGEKGMPFIRTTNDGNGARGRKVGLWKTFKKLAIDKEKCSKCGTCKMFCPETAIYWEKGEYPVFDADINKLDYCKGCKICVKECPKRAIEVIEL